MGHNDALARLIAEAGCSYAGVARRINDLGRSEGLILSYDYTAVHRWVKRGERPRNAVVAVLLAQVLSERLGRRITATDIGMPNESTLASRGLLYATNLTDTVDKIFDLGRADVNRRDIVGAPFVLSALAGPSRDWLLAVLYESIDERGPRRVGISQVVGIREMFRLFQEMDVMRGGGHARVALVEYLNSYVLPLLRRSHDHHVQQALYEAAAEQAYLVGWMAYDDGLHGLAQRYLIQSLRLAEASGNTILGAHVLAGMSDQANLLGYPQEALSLARAGQRAITIGDSAACLADLQILEARALASSPGDNAAAVAATVARAEQTFGQVNPAEEPEWARFIDPAYIFGEAAHCFRDLGDVAQIERFAGDSAAEATRQRRARRAALSQAALAIADITRGEPESAASKGLEVISLSESVHSSRCLETVRDLTVRFQPFDHLHEVQDFQENARQLLVAA